MIALSLFLSGAVTTYSQDPEHTPVPPPANSPVLIESDDPRVMRDGSWTAQDTPSASGRTYLYASGSPDDVLTLEFEGPSVEIIYVKHPAFGTLAIEIDGVVVRTVITTAKETAFDARAVVNYLEAGPHVLRVYAAEGTIAVDAFVAAVPFSGISTMSVVETVEAEQGQFVHTCTPLAEEPSQICITDSGTLARTTLTEIMDQGPYENDGAYPIWSPDGQRIVFVLKRVLTIGLPQDIDEFWIIEKDVQGNWGTPFVLSLPPLRNGFRVLVTSTLAWSPSSDKIAFVADRTLYYLELTEVCITNLSANCNAVKVVEESNVTYSSPSWSADSTQIVFARKSTQSGSVSSLYKATLGNPQPQPFLSTANVNYTLPSFSPDGTQIAFFREQGTTRSIESIPANGTTSTPILASVAPTFNLGWTHSGTQLFYTLSVGTSMVTAEGNPVLFGPVPGLSGARWRQGGTQITTLTNYGVYIGGLTNHPQSVAVENAITLALDRVSVVLYANFGTNVGIGPRPQQNASTAYNISPGYTDVAFNRIMRGFLNSPSQRGEIGFIFHDFANDPVLTNYLQTTTTSSPDYSFDQRNHGRVCWLYLNYNGGQNPHTIAINPQNNPYPFVGLQGSTLLNSIRNVEHQALIVCDIALVTSFEEATAAYYFGQIFIDRTGGTRIRTQLTGPYLSFYEYLSHPNENIRGQSVNNQPTSIIQGKNFQREACTFGPNNIIYPTSDLWVINQNCNTTQIVYVEDWYRGIDGWGNHAVITAPILNPIPIGTQNYWNTQPLVANTCRPWQQDPFLAYDWMIPSGNAARIREIRAAGADMFLGWVYQNNPQLAIQAFRDVYWGRGQTTNTCGDPGIADNFLPGQARYNWMNNAAAYINFNFCSPARQNCNP